MLSLTALEQMRTLVKELSDPAQIDSRPAMYRVVEPRTLRRNHDEVEVEAIEPKDLISTKIPLLFVHGLEYADHHDVMRDLVQPFLCHSGMVDGELIDRYDVTFVSWNSTLVDEHTYPSLHKLRQKSSLFSPLCMLLAANDWSKVLHHAERRALQVASFLEPYAKALWHDGRFMPQVVTHSMGSLIWADLIQNLSYRDELPPRLGRWLSLQPAIPYRSFCHGGRFDRVVDAYTRPYAMKEVWYSRLDMVLGTIYYLATRQLAMGQVGSPQKRRIPHIDMTWITGEAHGALSLQPARGCFLKRARELIRSRFCTPMI